MYDSLQRGVGPKFTHSISPGLLYVLWADPEFLITVLYSRSYVICFIYQAYLGSMNMGIEFTTAIFMVTFLVI